MTSDIPLQVLGGISARQFLRDYWQKKPLLIRQAIPEFQSPISPDELAGLSLEEEVESRLVIERGDRPWELRRGPFSEDTYQQLPEKDWTLLVQAADQLVPDVADLLEHFRFLPNWRIDDVMISYAAPGGSVGPHYDNYDVFLLQAHGQRRWRIGQMCDSESPMLAHGDLRILAELQHDARISNQELAERIGLSPSPCSRRVKQLEDDGYIARQVALLDRKKLGLTLTAYVLIGMDRHTPERFETFEAAIRSLPQVLECSLVTGMDADYQLKVVVPDMDHYQQFLLGTLTRIEGVSSVRSSFVLRQVASSTELPLEHLRS